MITLSLIFSIFFHSLLSLGSYKGKLIDASFQWNSDIPFNQIEKTIKKSDTNLQVGIFINNAYKNTEKISKILSNLKSSKQFFWGTPKYFMEPDAFENISSAKLVKEIDNYHFKFVSEIMYRHTDKINGTKHLTGERYFNPLNIKSVELIDTLSKLKKPIPIFIHWEFYKWKEDIESFSFLFKKFPNQVFIINHLGFGFPSQVEFILKNNQNVYFTISKRLRKFELFSNSKISQGPPLLEASKLNLDWKKIFITYPDRFLFAIDAHKPFMYDSYKHEIKNYRFFLGHLPFAIAEKIAYKNAKKLFNLKE